MKLLNSTTYKDKDFEIGDVRGFIDPIDFGLPVGFYGGRVNKVAKTDYPGIYLMVEKHVVIDILIKEEEFNVNKAADSPEGTEGDDGVEKVPYPENRELIVEEIDYYSHTNDELRDMLLKIGIEAPKRATKDELVALFVKEEE